MWVCVCKRERERGREGMEGQRGEGEEKTKERRVGEERRGRGREKQLEPQEMKYEKKVTYHIFWVSGTLDYFSFLLQCNLVVAAFYDIFK